MADGGSPAPQPPLVIPPVVSPAPLVQLPVPPAQPIQLPMSQLNRSHFRLEFAGKPDDDVEALLLRTNDWMDIHHVTLSMVIVHHNIMMLHLC